MQGQARDVEAALLAELAGVLERSRDRLDAVLADPAAAVPRGGDGTAPPPPAQRTSAPRDVSVG